MPDQITGKPVFTSGYYSQTIESSLDYQIEGSSITCTVVGELKDRETLTMRMEVSEEMFPQSPVRQWSMGVEEILMIVFAVLAIVYWAVFLRSLPFLSRRSTVPPEGYTAGELSGLLTGYGNDLTMMVFTWAQLGYLRIRVDRKGRVILEKRMDMGNERTDFEMKTFRSLFAKTDYVDATSGQYARLCRYVSETISGVREMYTKRAGNVAIFRILGCGISIFCGICYAMNIGKSDIIHTMLSIIFVIFGAVTAWGIQGGMYKIHVRGKIPLYVGAVSGLLWIVLGIVSGQWIMGLVVVAGQYLIGLLAAYGGRRSDLGKSYASQILGLRHYLRKLDDKKLERLLENNPDYFFDMLPLAIALGVDTRFAKAFGKMHLPDCHYLLVARDDKRTAAEWALIVRKIADRMDKRQRRLELEKWLPLNVRFY